MTHASIGTNDFERAVAFYDKVMATIGAEKKMSVPGAVAYGRMFPEFWVQQPIDGGPATVGNGTHFGLYAATKDQVDDFFKTAIEAGATSEGEPGPRPDYGPSYYACFIRDLDGHKVEAAFMDMSAHAGD